MQETRDGILTLFAKTGRCFESSLLIVISCVNVTKFSYSQTSRYGHLNNIDNSIL